MRPVSLILALLWTVTAYAADREPPRVAPLAEQPAMDRSICQVGNPSASTTYSGWWTGYEGYARRIDAGSGVCGCGVGVSVRSVHMRLLVPAGASLFVQARLLEADASTGDCMVPGRDLAWSGPIVVTGGATPTLRDIEVPCDFVCAEVGAEYFIVVDFANGGASGLQLIGGGTATDCVTYNDWGAGWVDLVGEMGFFDDLSIWADLDCCYETVGAADQSWGAVKAGYRRP